MNARPDNLDPVRAGIDAAAEPEEAWGELLPLVADVAAEAYPLDALPPLVRCAVEEVRAFVQAPVSMIAVSALSAIALAVQAHHDVQRAEGLHGPCSLFTLCIAESGERKSTCDGHFIRAIQDYERAEAEAAKPEIAAFRSAFDSWESKRSGLREKIKACAKDGKPSASYESELRELDAAEPAPPRVPRLVHADTTPEALAFNLAKEWPSGGIVSSEAGTVLGSHGMSKDSVVRNLALLNQLWDGATLRVDRRSSASFTVAGARLTMALQVQPSALRAFFDTDKGLARGTGFLARFLVAWPESTQGKRPFADAPHAWPALAAFNGRIAGLLQRPAPIREEGSLQPAMLALAPEAKAAWVAYHNDVEAELLPTGDLADVRDVASKSADNAARIAGLLHAFTGEVGAVGVQAMASGCRIAAWHLNESRRFLGMLGAAPEHRDAVALERWLVQACRSRGVQGLATREALQYGPSATRSKAAMDVALRELAEAGRVRQVKEGRKRELRLHPALLGLEP